MPLNTRVENRTVYYRLYSTYPTRSSVFAMNKDWSSGVKAIRYELRILNPTCMLFKTYKHLQYRQTCQSPGLNCMFGSHIYVQSQWVLYGMISISMSLPLNV